ncbi:MAG: GNAT family N-acetyltransferase [Alphaproteobacteria bacterium]|nr:GNAT family N-acetyltransferase [Alphaproteobacteria bacterium]
MQRLLINLPEIIYTPRLKLQMPKAGFGEKLHQAMMDGYEDGIRWLAWPPERPSIETVESDCRLHHAEFILRDYIRYIILEKETVNVVGGCAFPFQYANWKIAQFAISYFIKNSERSKGYATEAASAMTLLAFKILNSKKVEIYCDSENTASIKIPTCLNFKLEYIQKGGWPRLDGELAQFHAYSIFSPDDLPNIKVKW